MAIERGSAHRSAAASLVLRATCRSTASASQRGRDVKCGDVVTVALNGGVRVLGICGLALRRGNAAAALLYEEQVP